VQLFGIVPGRLLTYPGDADRIGFRGGRPTVRRAHYAMSSKKRAQTARFSGSRVETACVRLVSYLPNTRDLSKPMSSLPALPETDASTFASVGLGDAPRGVIYATLMGAVFWSVMIGVWSLV